MQDVVIDLERRVIEELSNAYPDVERQNDLPNMLYSIAEATGNKFIFIIDEWDCLFRRRRMPGCPEKIPGFSEAAL